MKSKLLLPLFIGIIFILINTTFQVDERLAGLLFKAQGSDWFFKEHFLTKIVIHEGGRYFIQILFIMLIVAFGFSCKYFRTYSYGLAFLIINISVSALCISALKIFLKQPCPWDLQYVNGIWRMPANLIFNGCAPSGHAGSGYAWMSLYFFCYHYCYRFRYYGLSIGIFIGLIFGISQQLRGAHFLSHDVASALICWSLSVIFSKLFFPYNPQTRNDYEPLFKNVKLEAH